MDKKGGILLTLIISLVTLSILSYGFYTFLFKEPLVDNAMEDFEEGSIGYVKDLTGQKRMAERVVREETVYALQTTDGNIPEGVSERIEIPPIVMGSVVTYLLATDIENDNLNRIEYDRLPSDYGLIPSTFPDRLTSTDFDEDNIPSEINFELEESYDSETIIYNLASEISLDDIPEQIFGTLPESMPELVYKVDEELPDGKISLKLNTDILSEFEDHFIVDTEFEASLPDNVPKIIEAPKPAAFTEEYEIVYVIVDGTITSITMSPTNFITPNPNSPTWNQEPCTGPENIARNVKLIAGAARDNGIDPNFALAIVAWETREEANGGGFNHCSKRDSGQVEQSNRASWGLGQINWLTAYANTYPSKTARSGATAVCPDLDILKLEQNAACSGKVLAFNKEHICPSAAEYERKVRRFCSIEPHLQKYLSYKNNEFMRCARAYNGLGCNVSKGADLDYVEAVIDHMNRNPPVWEKYLN